MAHNSVYVKGVTESVILAMRDSMVEALLKKGVSVIVDDTNLPQRTVRDLAKIAWRNGAEFEVVDLTDVPLELCLFRDSQREKPVGEEVIRDLHNRFLKGRSWPLDVPVRDEHTYQAPTYVNPIGKSLRVLVDLDGTVARNTGRPYYGFEPEAVLDDAPINDVICLVEMLYRDGIEPIYMSGRKDSCFEQTQEWIYRHGLPPGVLYMRDENDNRPDHVVKSELFDKHIAGKFNVRYVLDDRNQVVKMWREKYGLRVLQVADGDF